MFRQSVVQSVLVIGVLTATVALGWATLQQPDPLTVAGQLVSEDAIVQRRALESIAAADKRSLSEEVKAALATALLREAERNTRRYWQQREGKQLEPLPDPELLPRLARVVAEMEDSRAIPAMAAALGPGLPLVRGLATFGTAAVPDVIRVAMSPQSTHYAVNDGLVVLRMIVEHAGGAKELDRQTLLDMRRVARHHLITRPRFIGTVWWAMDLAVLLDDPTLRSVVERFAQDAELAVSMGASDDAVVLETQQRAAARLAGVPALPRP